MYPGPGATPTSRCRRCFGRVPLAVGGLALAAVFSAEMSAADAVLFMLSTSGARRPVPRFVRPAAPRRPRRSASRAGRRSSAALLGFALTFVYPTVATRSSQFYSVLVVTLFAPILGGLFLPRGGRWGAFAAMLWASRRSS